MVFLALCLNGSPHTFPYGPVCQTEQYSVRGCPFNMCSPKGFGPMTNALHIIHYTFQRFHGASNQLYADGTKIYTSLTPNSTKSNLTTLQHCISVVQGWMTQNRLKLNPDKTELLLIGTPAKRDGLAHHFPLDILGSPVSPCDSAKNLGVLFDSGLTFSNHMSNLCRTSYINIRILCRVRRYLSFKATIMPWSVAD